MALFARKRNNLGIKIAANSPYFLILDYLFLIQRLNNMKTITLFLLLSSFLLMAKEEISVENKLTTKEINVALKKVKKNTLNGVPPGKVRQFEIYPGLEVNFCWVPAGQFKMGSPISEEGRTEFENQHRVILTEGFWLAESECTQGQWELVMKENPSYFQALDSGEPVKYVSSKAVHDLIFNDEAIPKEGLYKTAPKGAIGSNNPVEQVSWHDVQKYLKEINRRGKLPEGMIVKLPTAAQWEYACRAGSEKATYFGDGLSSYQANFCGENPYGKARQGPCLERTTPVKNYMPNQWGLYDMYGNVWEWCMDSHRDYEGEIIDPIGEGVSHFVANEDGDRLALISKTKILRGGGWSSVGRLCRSAYILPRAHEITVEDYGFRMLITEPNQTQK